VIRFRPRHGDVPGATTPVLEGRHLGRARGPLCSRYRRDRRGQVDPVALCERPRAAFSGGRLNGTVTVDGRSTEHYRPRDLADTVGFVDRTPMRALSRTQSRMSLPMPWRNLGIDAATMRRRVEDVLDTLNLHALRNRAITTLSGGQRQRVAIGAAFHRRPPGRLCWTSRRHHSILSRPRRCSQPWRASSTDQGTTILVAEHRLERIAQFADVVIDLGSSPGQLRTGSPAAILRHSRPGAPCRPPRPLGGMVRPSPSRSEMPTTGPGAASPPRSEPSVDRAASER